MAYAFDTYAGNGSQTDFNITFPYINEDHVKVYVNYVNTSFTFEPNKSTARLASAPANGVPVEVRRITPLTGVLVDYADGSTLTAGDLDTSNLQHLYNAQELDDIQNKAISLSPTTGLPTASNRRVTEVADPTAAQDAATKNYVDTTRQPVDAELTELATMSSGTASSLADLTNTEVQILDGATVSTAEVNLLDGVTATTAEINYVDGVTSNVQTQLDAKQPLDAELTELATMASDTASSLADLTAAEVQALDGVTASTAEINILDGVTATAAELNTLDGVASTLTAAELNFVDGVTSALQTQLDGKQASDSDLTALSSCQTGAATNIALLTSGEVAILDGATPSTAELNTLSGITSSTGELNKLDGVTSTTANLNVVSGMTKATSLTSNSDTELPTSKAVADHVTGVVNALGGFVAINGPTNFPTTQPDQGVVVSIKDVGSGFTTSSNERTITNGAGSGKNVKITGFPSEYAAATLVDDTGLQVTSNKSASDFSSSPQVHQYVYHKQLAKESDVKQLSDDINAFNERYRTATGSNPSSNNHAGDLFFSQDTDKMYVRNAANSTWDEVVSVGEFFINTLSSLGSGSDNPPGGSATFNGTARKFTLSNPPSVAQQLIVSINGVIQKPNSGNSFPSEGFSLNGSALQLAAAPASGAPFFIITIGSTVNIGTPSAGTVDLAKLDTSNTGSTGQFLKKDGSTEGIGWATVSTDLVNDTSPQLGGDLASNGNDIDFADGDKAIFGAGADLAIWSGGASTYIQTQHSGGTIYLGTTSANNQMNITSSGITVAGNSYHTGGVLNLQDNVQAQFGTASGGDLQIYHSTNNYFDTKGQNVIFRNRNTDGGVDENMLSMVPNGGVYLYHDGNLKCSTYADGLNFPDVGTAAFGAGNDMKLYHYNGVNYIQTGNTTNIEVKNGNETMASFKANSSVDLYYDNALRLETKSGGVNLRGSDHWCEGNWKPWANNTYDLGDSTYRWRNIYTNDLNLSNEGSANEVDGTWGSYTIQEGAEDLYLINKRNGKKYKFNLTEVS